MNRLLIVVISILALSANLYGDLAPSPTETFTLDNGMTIILKENHSSPMITSIVFVNAGARYETDYNNGVTHFLEHLMFDGTKSRSREELNETAEMYGGYINAFTREDLTAYMILMPKENIDIGLDIQSDQLFNSIIPEEELPKERKIVIEEMKMSIDNPDYQAEAFTRNTIYRGTPYVRPVLGYENIISTIPRERIMEYYKTYYMPNNMTALVIGDFETADMLAKFENYYGAQTAQPLPEFDKVELSIPAGKKIKRAELETTNSQIELAMNAPHFTDPDYFAFYLLAEYLGSGDTSPLDKAFTKGESPLAQSVSASLQTQRDFSLLHISATTDMPENADRILSGIDDLFVNIDNVIPSENDLHGLVVSLKTNDIYLREKLHYYGIMIAPMMVSTGYDFLENLIPNLEEVTRSDVRRVAAKYFTPLSYTGTVVTPKTEAETETATVSNTEYKKEVLPNGLTVVIKSNPDSRVFAVNIIGKNRSAMEPEGKDGITDFVNRVMTEATSTYNGDQLASELASIGANLTVTDNPYIPYDDFYTTHQYAFVKFETIDEFSDKGMAMLSDIIRNAIFTEEDVEQTRRQMMGFLGRSSGSPREQCRNAFNESLFPNSAYSKPIMGSQRTIAGITRDDLLAYYKTFYSPGNMILSVCTNGSIDDAMAKLVKYFGDMEPVESPAIIVGEPVQPSSVLAKNVPMDKEQVYIYIGGPTPGIQSEDAPALKVAGDILSDRMSLELREKQGLAYSVGASVSFDKDFGWYVAVMGTGIDNYETAKDGMLAEIKKLQEGAIDPDELTKAKNSLWGSSLTRNLSRVNQAYYMGVNEYLGVGYAFSDNWIGDLRTVTADDVQRVAKKYFSTEKYVIATAGLPE
ncbi:MAG: pitrilysin family protein [Candidatus Zixiibacteriota bacterium]